MTPKDIANIAIRTCFEHYGHDDMPATAEQLRWKQLVEQCRLKAHQVDAILSEMAAEHERLKSAEIFPIFQRIAFAQSIVAKEQREERSGKTDCAYCRGTGFAPTYNPNNPQQTVSVLCLCGEGVRQQERMATAKNPVKIPSAKIESVTRNAVFLFHQHESERLEQWQKDRGLNPDHRDQFFRKFKSMYLAKLPALFKTVPKLATNAQVGGLPATVDERELQLAAYHNGDERGWE
jgi:hypothetical protein